MIGWRQAAGWRRGRWALGLCQAALLIGITLPAAAVDPRDDIVLGALLAEFYLAIAVSLEEPTGNAAAAYAKETVAMAAQLARLISPSGETGADDVGGGDFDLALGAFLAFATQLENGAGAPLDAREARDFACHLVGSDPVTFAELGRRAGIDGDGAKVCARDFEQAAALWNDRFSSFRLGPGLNPPLGAGPLYVEIAPVFNPANEAITDTLRSSQIYDVLAERLNTQMALPSGRVLLITECGGNRAFYNPARREIVLCDERIAAWIGATAAQRP